MVIDEDLAPAQRILKEMAPEPAGAEEASRERNHAHDADTNVDADADAEAGADGTPTF